jgi:hypothetical protein
LAIAMPTALYALDILAMLLLIPECRGAENDVSASGSGG